VLVTGGAGFIGSTVVDLLLSLGYRVRVLDNLSTGRRSNLPAAHARLEFVEGDVRAPESCRAAVNGASLVLHLAAFSRVAPSLSGGPSAAQECVDANVLGTLNVLEAARATGVARLIYAGSSTAYGGGDELSGEQSRAAAEAYGADAYTPLLPSWELDRPMPSSPYAATKLMGEQLSASYDATYGLHTAVLRLFMVYGPREPASGEHATVVGRFVEDARAGRPLTLEGGGGQTRDFVHVSDVARAFVLAMQAPELPRRAVINVGSGVGSSVAHLAGLVHQKGARTQAPRRRLDMQGTLADVCAARRLLGWEAEVTLEEGVRQLKAELEL